MTKKQINAMIERKKKEQQEMEEELEEIDEEELDEVFEEDTDDDDDEVCKILAQIDFDIDYCTDQETITSKILYFANEERRVLEQFKDKDDVLINDVYFELYNTIIDVFSYYSTILKKRLNLIIESEKLQAKIKELQFTHGELRRDEIDSKYEIKLLKYHNRLYAKQKHQEYKVARKKEREQSKAKLQALKTHTPEKLPP